jgi:hypothetical protein
LFWRDRQPQIPAFRIQAIGVAAATINQSARDEALPAEEGRSRTYQKSYKN